MARQIAAIDRRDIFWMQRLAVRRRIPIVEMSPESLERFHAFEHCAEPVRGVQRADPAEIARREDGKKIKADIGRRRSVRDGRLGIFLEIGGWKIAISHCDE